MHKAMSTILARIYARTLSLSHTPRKGNVQPKDFFLDSIEK